MKGNNGLGRNRRNGRFAWLAGMYRFKAYAIMAVIIVFVVSAAYLVRKCSGDSLTVRVKDSIDITPTQVKAMKEIGEWEFLAIEDEEMVDTTRRGLFINDELVRIYKGTLRLGIDMSEVADDWISKSGDTLVVMLPKIKLLDEDFIDEAATQSFFESGAWSDKAREDMYHRAREKMKARCLTKENIRSAEDNACRQFFQMFKAMGAKQVHVRFEAGK